MPPPDRRSLRKRCGRNKLFWFFAYEGLKDSQPAPAILTVPADAERRGYFSALLAAGSQYQIYNPFTAVLNGTVITRSPFPNNIIPRNLLNPIAQAYLKLYPEPNVTVHRRRQTIRPTPLRWTTTT